mgnify:CR=1 FL=1
MIVKCPKCDSENVAPIYLPLNSPHQIVVSSSNLIQDQSDEFQLLSISNIISSYSPEYGWEICSIFNSIYSSPFLVQKHLMQPLKQLTSLPKTFYVPAYPTVNAIPALSHLLLLQIPIEISPVLRDLISVIFCY